MCPASSVMTETCAADSAALANDERTCGTASNALLRATCADPVCGFRRVATATNIPVVPAPSTRDSA